MSIPAAAKPTPIPPANAEVAVVDRSSGLYTLQELQRQERMRGYVSGMGRIIPCMCVSSSNFLTLTPNGVAGESGEAPVIEGYKFGEIYLFVADASSTGNVTATVVPKTGALATIKVYINGGAAQAGNGDITSGRVYLGVYVYSLDSDNGGIVIRHP
jgi:hypothetical protein